MTPLTITVNSEAETCQLGQQLARALAPGTVVGLDGPLGAGKTTLVRSIVAALGANPRQVASPTFVLMHQYEARTPIYHFDAYRLKSANEFWELGIQDYFESAGISIIEWASRVAECLPDDHILGRAELTGESSRQWFWNATGSRSAEILRKLESSWQSRAI